MIGEEKYNVCGGRLDERTLRVFWNVLFGRTYALLFIFTVRHISPYSYPHYAVRVASNMDELIFTALLALSVQLEQMHQALARPMRGWLVRTATQRGVDDQTLPIGAGAGAE